MRLGNLFVAVDSRRADPRAHQCEWLRKLLPKCRDHRRNHLRPCLDADACQITRTCACACEHLAVLVNQHGRRLRGPTVHGQERRCGGHVEKAKRQVEARDAPRTRVSFVVSL